MKRRLYLATVGAAISLVGCASEEEGTEPSPSNGSSPTDTQANSPTTNETEIETETRTDTETETETQSETETETESQVELEGEWPQPSRDPQNTASAPEYESPESPDILWEFEVEGSSIGAVAVANNTIYSVSNDQKIYSLDAVTGTENWSFDTGSSANPVFPPIVVDESVYILNDSGVRAISLDPLELSWDFNTGLRPNGITYGAETVFVGTVRGDYDPGKIYALTDAGNQKWSFATSKYGDGRDEELYHISGYPAVSGGKVFFGAKRVHAHDQGTGTQIWETSLKSGQDGRWWATTGTAVSEKTLCVGYRGIGRNIDENGIALLSVDDGTLRRRMKMPHRLTQPPAITEDAVYAIDTQGLFKAFDRSSGVEKWSFNAGGGGAIPVVSSEKVHVAADNTIFARDSQTGEFKWSRSIGENSVPPVVVSNIVYHSHGPKISALMDMTSV